MPGRLTARPKPAAARREAVAKPRMGKAKDLRLHKVLEEWLAEARIRYTHAGD